MQYMGTNNRVKRTKMEKSLKLLHNPQPQRHGLSILGVWVVLGRPQRLARPMLNIPRSRNTRIQNVGVLPLAVNHTQRLPSLLPKKLLSRRTSEGDEWNDSAHRQRRLSDNVFGFLESVLLVDAGIASATRTRLNGAASRSKLGNDRLEAHCNLRELLAYTIGGRARRVLYGCESSYGCVSAAPIEKF